MFSAETIRLLNLARAVDKDRRRRVLTVDQYYDRFLAPAFRKLDEKNARKKAREERLDVQQTADRHTKLIALYESGQSLRDVGKDVGLSMSRVHQVLIEKRPDLIRPRGGVRRDGEILKKED